MRRLGTIVLVWIAGGGIVFAIARLARSVDDLRAEMRLSALSRSAEEELGALEDVAISSVHAHALDEAMDGMLMADDRPSLEASIHQVRQIARQARAIARERGDAA